MSEREFVTKDEQFMAKGEILVFDLAPLDQRWEFAQEEWCEYAAQMGKKMIEAGNLDLSKYNWAFTEEYAHTPERLMAGRDVAGYYIMIKDGKVSAGAGVPQDSLDLPGFHVNVEWALIAQPSAFFYGRDGGGRGKDSGQLAKDLEAAGYGQDKNTLRKLEVNRTNGPVREQGDPNIPDSPCVACGSRFHEYAECLVWPKGVGETLSVDSEKGGGLHNFTALHLFSSPEVKDLPQTDWGVPIFTEMTEEQKTDFLRLIGRL